MKVESENRFLGIFTKQMKETLFSLNVDQLFVDAGLDVNHDRLRVTAGRNGHDRVLDRLELASAIERDDYVDWFRCFLGVTARVRRHEFVVKLRRVSFSLWERGGVSAWRRTQRL